MSYKGTSEGMESRLDRAAKAKDIRKREVPQTNSINACRVFFSRLIENKKYAISIYGNLKNLREKYQRPERVRWNQFLKGSEWKLILTTTFFFILRRGSFRPHLTHLRNKKSTPDPNPAAKKRNPVPHQNIERALPRKLFAPFSFIGREVPKQPSYFTKSAILKIYKD